MNNEEILKSEFEEIKKDLIEKYISKGFKATGNWANELEVEQKGLSVKLLGAHYTKTITEGLPPNTNIPYKELIPWIEAKPITPIGVSVSTLAYLIANSIYRKGTKIWQEGGDDWISEVITPERIDSIISKVSRFQISEFNSEVVKMFNELAAA